MADRNTIQAALIAILEQTFPAGSIEREAKVGQRIDHDTGLLILDVNSPTVQRADFLQQEVTYDFLFQYKRAGKGDTLTERDQMYADLEKVRADLASDPSLSLLVIESTGFGLLAQSEKDATDVYGSMLIQVLDYQ